MRAGRLRHRVNILALSHQLAPVAIGSAWTSIVAKDNAEAPAASGLRTSAKVTVRARFNSQLRQDVYLRHQNRLLHVTSSRDVMGARSELVLTCDEFVGADAVYYPTGEPPVQCRVHLTHGAPYLDDFGKVTSYQTKAEVLLIEVGRPQEGDRIQVNGVMFIVTQYASDTDDGVVRGLWLDPME